MEVTHSYFIAWRNVETLHSVMDWDERARKVKNVDGLRNRLENWDDAVLDKKLAQLKKVTELRRTGRQFLSTIQSEMFSNPNEYMEFVKKYQSTDGLQQAMSMLSNATLIAAKSETASLGKLGDKQDMIQRLVGLLMSYQIIFPSYFGDDDDFVDLAV